MKNSPDSLVTIGRLAGAAAGKLAAFAGLIDELRRHAQSLTLEQIVQLAIERSGLIAHYRNDKEGRERIENLEELVNAASAFVAEEGYSQETPGTRPDSEAALASPLAAFLAHAALEAGDNQAQAGQDALQLMTVHAAKGLEFDAVFITGLEEGLFPHENSVQQRDGLEEERRLMYVAITRARKRLSLSFAQTRMLHGQTRYGIRSRFLEEIPEGVLKWLAPRVRAPFADRRADVGARAAWGGAASAAPPARSATLHGFRVGQSVRHARFGDGVIVRLEGDGSDARARINFGPNGLKELALAIAKLEAA